MIATRGERGHRADGQPGQNEGDRRQAQPPRSRGVPPRPPPGAIGKSGVRQRRWGQGAGAQRGEPVQRPRRSRRSTSRNRPRRPAYRQFASRRSSAAGDRGTRKPARFGRQHGAKHADGMDSRRPARRRCCARRRPLRWEPLADSVAKPVISGLSAAMSPTASPPTDPRSPRSHTTRWAWVAHTPLTQCRQAGGELRVIVRARPAGRSPRRSQRCRRRLQRLVP